ncbi:MAG: double-strand break repair protein AddB [Beijerinckiaceae bacterium]|nr:double-strand break repair protein AddB [Beijerinckiaceae bacterium]
MKKHVYTIASGAPFLKTFAAALLEGLVVEGFPARSGPFEMADATIYVPTRRSAQALSSEFARATGGKTAILSRILPLGALEETETDLFFEETEIDGAHDPRLPQAASEITRRLHLATLILKWARALPHAIVSVDSAGKHEFDNQEPLLVAASAADAWHLAGELANLIDELIIEDVAWERLDPLALPEFDRYWKITLDFLDIAVKEWPKILAERGLADKARRQVALIEAQIGRLKAGVFPGPVIAIGSTGTNRATARLLAAIAASPKGAIVLPGLDLDLDTGAWDVISGKAGEGIEQPFTHPQSALSRLLGILQIKREEVVSLGAVEPVLAMRGKFLSEALRPAESTDEWIDYRQSWDQSELASALEGVTFIEAGDEREEALALAIAMRQVLETSGETAALVTPDRKLARRVRAELARWGVDAEDSAGEPLSMRPIGVLARLLTGCAASKMAAPEVSALLAHPLLRLGLSRDDVKHCASLLEIGLLRSACAALCLAPRIVPDPSSLIAAAKEEASGTYAHPAKKRISARQWDTLEDFLSRLGSALAPLLNMEGEHGLGQWVEAHRAALDAAMDGGGIDDRDVEALDTLFDELAETAPGQIVLGIESYGQLFAGIAREVTLRGPAETHPRLQILGLLEARLIGAGVMLLGGLDETVWPPQARTDAFLNRPMRAALGLMPPERRLGQTAHDFTQAMGKRKAILSRACKRDGAPASPSRFLQRMAALGGDAWIACRTRGEAYLHLAREIDRPMRPLQPITRPLPRPPVARRPTRLSVTQIETLRRDPYAIYADKILQLRELDPLGGPTGAAEFGSAIHAALDRFVKRYPAGALPQDAREALLALLRESLAASLQDPEFAALRFTQLEKMAGFYLGFEARRRGGIVEIKTECDGKLKMPLADGSVFTLTARADRIELNSDKTVTLVDYKTGAPPVVNEIQAGFAPQLTLEAAMAMRGAFGFQASSADGLYVKLGGPKGGEEKPAVSSKSKVSFLDEAESHYSGLLTLLNQFRDEATAYPPRPFPKYAKRYNAYDHLARVKEWSITSEAEGGL